MNLITKKGVTYADNKLSDIEELPSEGQFPMALISYGLNADLTRYARKTIFESSDYGYALKEIVAVSLQGGLSPNNPSPFRAIKFGLQTNTGGWGFKNQAVTQGVITKEGKTEFYSTNVSKNQHQMPAGSRFTALCLMGNTQK